MNNELYNLVLSYLLSLTVVIVLPITICIISSSRIFCRFRSINHENFQERVRESIEETTIERVSQILEDLFPQYGMTHARNAPFPRVIQHLLNGVEESERLSYLANIYNSLVENGIQSPFFNQIVQVFIYMMGGGG